MTPAELRRRLASRDQLPVLMPGVWDALSTRLAVEAGFEVVFLSGYCLSGTLLGMPDYGFVTQVEVADAARRVVAAASGNAAVVVDGDTGYGNPLNVLRTVELFESAGAAAMFLEDQVWPKRCGHMAGKQVVPADEWLAKLSAALDRRQSLLVVARTDARAAVSMDEAISRGLAAAALGVDAVFVEAPESVDELRQVRDAIPDVPLVANMVEAGRTPLLTPAELGALGYSLIVSPLSGLFAATKAMRSAFATLRAEGTLRDRLDDLVGFDEFSTIVDLERYTGLEARYRRS